MSTDLQQDLLPFRDEIVRAPDDHQGGRGVTYAEYEENSRGRYSQVVSSRGNGGMPPPLPRKFEVYSDRDPYRAERTRGLGGQCEQDRGGRGEFPYPRQGEGGRWEFNPHDAPGGGKQDQGGKGVLPHLRQGEGGRGGFNSFIAKEPYVALRLAICYATRRGTKTVQNNSILPYQSEKLEGRSIFYCV